MKVHELMDELADLDDDAEVILVYPSGDYWRTEVGKVVKYVETRRLRWSDYHNKWELPSDDDDEGVCREVADDEKEIVAVVLR